MSNLLPTLRPAAPVRPSRRTRPAAFLGVLLATGVCSSPAAPPETLPPAPAAPAPGFRYLDTGIENGSPLWHEFRPDGVLLIHLLYDHERASPNRAAGHIRFVIHGQPGTGLTLEFTNLDNVWNGQPGSVAGELRALTISDDGRSWRTIATELLPGNRVQARVHLSGTELHVARLEPYTLTDLERLLGEIRTYPRVRITTIGRTVQGRPLEIIRIGRLSAPNHVLIRARAHPWESGGNWVVEGLIRRLLRNDSTAQGYLRRYCLHVLPMANKDGVASGRTRFNLRGMDLNRNWDRPADPELAPENAALERWLEEMIRAGRRPRLALELHNDGSGLLHLSRPDTPGLADYLDRMQTLESLLRKHTWFTEGSTRATFHNPGTLGDGWLERFGVDAVIHEFNCHWIAGLKERPLGRHWREYGENLATVIDEYLAATAQSGIPAATAPAGTRRLP